MEYEDHEGQVLSFVAGLALGAILGAGVALLTAPEKGKKTRRRLVKAARDARDTAQDRFEYISDEVRDRVDGAVQGARQRISR
ncbi:MAG: YtxH domain-containing protein [Gemmatimonadales bacterium]|nr:MAG: YtxH domain-containing protein [Gemmatimonadales bacterium]